MSPSRRPTTPRATSHRGSVLAAGYWVSDDVPDQQSRVLELWEEGGKVLRTPSGFVVLLARPRRVVAELGSAAALVRQGQSLTSAPLRPRELESLPGTLQLVLEGSVHSLTLEQLDAVDPAAWLDVGDFELKRGKSLGETATLGAALSKALDPQVMFDQSVGRSADDRARQTEVLQALQQAAQQQAAQQAKRGLRSSSGPGVALRVGALVVGLVRGIASFFARPNRARAQSPARNDSSLAKLPPRSPGLWQRFTTALSNWLVRTRLGAFLGRKHAEYFQNLFELLAQQDDEEVLRRAIPLGKGDGVPGPPALLPPGPRNSFDISFGPRTAGPSVSIGSLYEHLRRSYEAVFKRLEAAGKHEQAAYFLAEILNEPERAVSYLERHGERVLAAKLAEARELPPGLVVRQWFLAGDRERAILIAVREGAFNDALVRLEASGHREEASALRLLQAERLATAGLFVRAAQLIHREERGKGLALRWLELARAAGDLRGVALELSLAQKRFDAVHAALVPLLASGAEQLPTLLFVAEEFAVMGGEAGKPLARELGRELLAIASETGMARVATAAVNVANYVGGAFRADQPRVLTFEKRLGGAIRRYEHPASDAGTAPAHDVHRFGSHILVALGEAGVVLLNRQGKRVAHFELPAQTLVTAPGSGRVLCVGRRGGRLEVGRIDLATRRSERWCELEVVSFAREFDGETWLVCEWDRQRGEGELLQLDVLDAKPRVLRRLPIPLYAPTIHLEGRHVNLVGSDPFGPVERMRYELPQLTLRQRLELVPFEPREDEDSAGPIFLGAAAAHGDAAASVYECWHEVPNPTFKVQGRTIQLPSHQLERGVRLDLSEAFYALTFVGDTSTRIFLGAQAASEPHVDLVLHGASQCALRFYPDLLLIADSAGRIIGVDPLTGAPVYDLRT